MGGLVREYRSPHIYCHRTYYLYNRKNYGFICQIKILVCLFACLFILLKINVLKRKK